MRHQSIKIHLNCLKRGKTRVTKSRLVLVLDVIGYRRRWREFSRQITERNKAESIMQSRITFDTQLKIAQKVRFLFRCMTNVAPPVTRIPDY